MRVFAVAFLDKLRRRNEAHRRRIHAVAQAGRKRAVVEQVAEVRIGVLRANFGARHSKGPIRLRCDVLRNQRTREAGPPSAGLELVGRAEQRFARHNVYVDARLVIVPVCVLERTLGRFVLRDLVLERGEGLLQAVVAWLFEVRHGVATRSLGNLGRLRGERPRADDRARGYRGRQAKPRDIRSFGHLWVLGGTPWGTSTLQNRSGMGLVPLSVSYAAPWSVAGVHFGVAEPGADATHSRTSPSKRSSPWPSPSILDWLRASPTRD